MFTQGRVSVNVKYIYTRQQISVSVKSLNV